MPTRSKPRPYASALMRFSTEIISPTALVIRFHGPTRITLDVSDRGDSVVVTISGIHAPAQISGIRNWQEWKTAVKRGRTETARNPKENSCEPRGGEWRGGQEAEGDVPRRGPS